MKNIINRLHGKLKKIESSIDAFLNRKSRDELTVYGMVTLGILVAIMGGLLVAVHYFQNSWLFALFGLVLLLTIFVWVGIVGTMD